MRPYESYILKTRYFSDKNRKYSTTFDLFISPNPKAAHINVEAMAADYMLLSQGYMDHIADAVVIATIRAWRNIKL